jgi:hypothetical protein
MLTLTRGGLGDGIEDGRSDVLCLKLLHVSEPLLDRQPHVLAHMQGELRPDGALLDSRAPRAESDVSNASSRSRRPLRSICAAWLCPSHAFDNQVLGSASGRRVEVAGAIRGAAPLRGAFPAGFG